MLTRCTAGGDAVSQAVCDHALTDGPLVVGSPLVNSLVDGLLPIHSSLGAVPSIKPPTAICCSPLSASCTAISARPRSMPSANPF